MLTLVGENPSWLVGWESSHVYEQTRRMIRVTCSCKGSRGWKHIVNGHHFVTTRVGHLVTVLYQGTQRGRVQSAWEGTLTRGERAPTGEEGAPPGGGGEGGGSQIFSPQPPTGHRCFCRVLWVTSTAQLSTVQGVADHYCRPSPSTYKDFWCLLPCWCSCLALSSP